jgi:hypothetical protein
MTIKLGLRLSLFALACSLTWTAHAESFASSASSAGSASSGSISDSLHSSSGSSKDNNKTAQGDYHIIEMAKLAERPGIARITMQASDTDQRIELDLPQAIVDKRGLARGDLVHAQPRVYGIEFAHGEAHEVFFLALTDTWYKELGARKVTL